MGFTRSFATGAYVVLIGLSLAVACRGEAPLQPSQIVTPVPLLEATVAAIPAPKKPEETLTIVPTQTETPKPSLEATVAATPMPSPSPTPAATSTPAAEKETKVYYTQFKEVKGIYVKASGEVNPAALDAAAKIIEIMLQGRADIATTLSVKKAELAIIPKDKYATTLPEFMYLAGKKDANGNPYDSFNIRGLGAVPGQPVTATSEENLLKLPGDPFRREDITFHEFGHAIMNLTFTQQDNTRWTQIYQTAKSGNVFPRAFALTNKDECFAELTQSYFGVNNEIGKADAIREKLPDAFTFLQEIYGKRP